MRRFVFPALSVAEICCSTQSPHSAFLGITTSPSQRPDSAFRTQLNQMRADPDGLRHAPLTETTPEFSSCASILIRLFSPSPTVTFSNQIRSTSGGMESDSGE